MQEIVKRFQGMTEKREAFRRRVKDVFKRFMKVTFMPTARSLQ